MLLSRKPIFDRGRKVCGYELIYNVPDEIDEFGSNKVDLDWITLLANVSVVDSGFGNGRMLINYCPGEKHKIESSVSKEIAVLNFGSAMNKRDQAALAELKKKGYAIAVDSDSEIESAADFVIVDTRKVKVENLNDVVSPLRAKNIKTLASGVDSVASLIDCLNVGFDYFSGDFYRETHFSSSKKPTASQASRLELLTMLESDSCDFEALSVAIEKDVSISYRLLGFLNSPSFGFGNKISSVRQAVTLAGWDIMSHWLRLAILTDIDATPRGEHLAYLSAQRGRFMELLSLRLGMEDKQDTFFLLGLFSLLDVLLALPMKEILSEMPLDEEIKKTLCHEESIYGKWFSILDSVDAGNWDRFKEFSTAFALDTEDINEDYFDSVIWANSFFYQ